jgi:hypothetical protein
MIRDQEDPYTFKYNTLPPVGVSYEASAKSEREFTLADVANRVDQWGHDRGWLGLFADLTLTTTSYFEIVAKPRLSIKTTGNRVTVSRLIR